MTSLRSSAANDPELVDFILVHVPWQAIKLTCGTSLDRGRPPGGTSD